MVVVGLGQPTLESVMSDKPTEDQPVQGEVNKQAPETPSTRNDSKPTSSGKPSDRKGQTREPGYDEA
jgi:hypothetical protein